MNVKQIQRRRLAYFAVALCLALAVLYFSLGILLTAMGSFLVKSDKPTQADAVVVLSTGVEYIPRLMEAAQLFQEGYTKKVVVNGNRKTEVIRDLEARGYTSDCPWDEEVLRILSFLGVPRERVLAINAEDAYDTVSESRIVGAQLIMVGIKKIIVTTSKYHTRRARFIWEKNFPHQFSIQTVAARTDPYSPTGWWKEGRQIRWVLAEYGAWLYYFWKRNLDSDQPPATSLP